MSREDSLPTGNSSELSFHLDVEGGLEFVFSSGRHKNLVEHTHMSTCTVTLVRSGQARLSPKADAAAYTAGAVYAIAPHQPHQPEYRAGYDLVSICLKLKLLAALTPRQRRDFCSGRAAPLLASGLLSPEDLRRLIEGLDRLPAYQAPPDFSPPISAWLEDLDNLTISDTARIKPVLSPFYFIRRFKQEMGLTPHKYLMQYRLSLAKLILRANPSIAEVAQAAGFYDQSHLDRCFKKGVGLSPSDYRRALYSLPR